MGYSKQNPIITKAAEDLKSLKTNTGKQIHMQYPTILGILP